MQNYQQYPQYPYQGQPLPPVSMVPAQAQPQPDGTAPASHPLAPLATISFWSTVVQRTLQVESPAAVTSSDPFSSAATVTHQPPQPLPQPHLQQSQQYHQYHSPVVTTSATPQPQPLPPPQTDLLSLILGIPPVVPTALGSPPPPSRVATPYQQQQQQQQVPPQSIHQQSSSFFFQQQPQPVPIHHQQQSYWPVAPAPQSAPTATSLTHDLGISLLHLAIAAARFGFKATTALTHFIVSNPLTRPLAHLWIHALKQLATFAVNAVKVIVHAVITGGQPPPPQQSIMGTVGGGDGNAAMASMMMQLATAAAAPGMMGGPSSARW